MFGVFLALAAQAVAPANVHATLPMPISHYISPLDYPAPVVPQRTEGTVDLTLAVDRNGRVTACTIRKSSGSPVLDAATCSLLQRRAKFTPARTAAGQPTSDVIETSIDWRQLPRRKY